MGSKKSKKSVKKARGKSSSKKKKSGLLKKLFKVMLVASLWCGIIGTLIIAWYASELPQITADVKFDRKRSITFLAAEGDIIAQVGELKGETINVSQLPPHVIHALLSIEDRRFYSHFGVDPLGIARAMVKNIAAGRFAEGGSTITQQLAKNLFLTPDQNLKRKIQEALLALWLEHKLTKDEILTAYFNRVYFGAGTYGIQAASQRYFHKNAGDLSVYEGAMLAGLLKAPSRYSPLSNPERAKERTQVVLRAMKDAGYHYSADSGGTDLHLVKAVISNARQERYFTDWLMDTISQKVGASDDDLIVQTTLSLALQRRTERALLNKLKAIEGDHVSQGAVVVLENDGAVRAMIGGRNYEQSQFNRATQALRPPGSSFKPLVYLTALNRGMRPDDIILDAPITEGSYRPKNFADHYYGQVTLSLALAYSLNTVAVRIADQVGIGYVIGTARKLGITSDLSRDLSLALGSSGVSLIEMTSAYTVFPNLGIRPDPYAILSIRDHKGNTYYEFDPHTRTFPRLFSETISYQMNQMLQNVIRNGTATSADPGFPAGGKTGTSQDFRDAWFIGFTPRYTAGVWLGNDDNSPMIKMTGGKAPAQIWGDIMRGTPAANFLETSPLSNTPPTEPQQPAQKSAPSSGGFSGFLSRIISGESTPRPGAPPPRNYNQ